MKVLLMNWNEYLVEKTLPLECEETTSNRLEVSKSFKSFNSEKDGNSKRNNSLQTDLLFFSQDISYSVNNNNKKIVKVSVIIVMTYL